MWSRQLFIFCFLTLTICATQSHVIHKRGLISRLFGGKSKSNRDIDADLPVKERSRFRKLLKNPVVIVMLSAAVGMIIQKALAARSMTDVCENKYVKMALSVGDLNPQFKEILNLIGCNKPKQEYDSSTIPNNKNSTIPNNRVPTTVTFEDDEDENENEKENDEQPLESVLTPEKQSKIQQLLNVARGEKGAKRNFLRSLFGFRKKDYGFKPGQKIPSSTYKLDKDDVNSLKELEKELDEYNKSIN